MNWLFIVLSFVWPVVQPTVQQSVQNVQQRVQQRMQQARQQPAKAAEPVPQYYFDGKDLYCHWNGQWWIWRSNDAPTNR